MVIGLFATQFISPRCAKDLSSMLSGIHSCATTGNAPAEKADHSKIHDKLAKN
jgi:hypothetical protein